MDVVAAPRSGFLGWLTRTERPPLTRPRQGRWLGGVATGVAAHLELPVTVVRVALVVTTFFGFGPLFYVWLWAGVPVERVVVPRPGAPRGFSDQTGVAPVGVAPVGVAPVGVASVGMAPVGIAPELPPVPAAAPVARSGAAVGPGPHFPVPSTASPFPAAPLGQAPLTSSPFAPPAPSPPPAVTSTVPPSPLPQDVPLEESLERGRSRRADIVGGVILVVIGFALLATRQGWDIGMVPVLPVVIVLGGAVLAYLQLDEVSRSRWTARGVVGTRGAVLRVAAGLALVIIGVLLAVVENTGIAAIGHTLAAVAAVLAGAVIVLAPWGVRLWTDLGTERTERARESERADIAAHLHDSVLQTLALIQRSSGDPAEVTRLARAQERDLRGWLYTGNPVDPARLTARVAQIAAEAEDVYGVVVDVVTVGDREVDVPVAALLAALREAVVNAVRHAGGATVRIYVESGPDGVEAFVKDRGAGFDLDLVPPDRLGVRESILGRMRRHGGSAEVISAPGAGTEVRLVLPDQAEERMGQ